jgi:predicted DsbA family dithiol-disulfide isomerase
MTWNRVILRNFHYYVAYDGTVVGNILGDLNRLKADTLDANHLNAYANLSGATPEQVEKILKAFFDQNGPFNMVIAHCDKEL